MNANDVATAVAGVLIAGVVAALGFTAKTIYRHYQMKRASERLNRHDLNN